MSQERGNRHERVFFEDGDYAIGSETAAGASASRSQAYCQPPNQVHLILTPEDGEGLALALSRTHRLYAGSVNARAGETGPSVLRAGLARWRSTRIIS